MNYFIGKYSYPFLLFGITSSLYLLTSNNALTSHIDELKKDHTRFIVSPDAEGKIGKFAIEVKIENEPDPQKAQKIKSIVTEAVDESFNRLLLGDRLSKPEKADSLLLIRMVESEKIFKFARLHCISYGYARLFIDLIDQKTRATIFSGVSEGFESKSDTFFLDYWLRKKLLKKAIEQAVEKTAVKLKSITQGQPPEVDMTKPLFVEKKLAVLPFGETSPEAQKEGMGKLVSNMMTTAMGPMRTFIVLERLQVEKAIEELNFGQSGYLEDESAKKIGKLLGADFLIVGNVGAKGNAVEVDSRLVDIETGQVLATAGETVANPAALRSAAGRMASRLTTDYLKGPARRW